VADVNPTRVVADADVLAVDLLVGGESRAALDHVRRHSWMTLVASPALLDDAHAVIARLADDALAADWRRKIETLVELVDHPPGDHPALASAYRGNAAHVLTYDETMLTTKANTATKRLVETSFKPPGGFARLFDPERLYPEVSDDPYPGPDRDPRA
jgi:predicted nucleic acid-binding protein